MNMNSTKRCMLCLAVVGWCLDAATAQVVRVALIVKQGPTPNAQSRRSGAVPPESDSTVESDAPFYVEIWASNTAQPLDGLACVYVDLSYDRTDLIDVVPPAQDGPQFPINAVSPVFDDPSGAVVRYEDHDRVHDRVVGAHHSCCADRFSGRSPRSGRERPGHRRPVRRCR